MIIASVSCAELQIFILNSERLEKIPTQTENMTDWELVHQHDRLFVKIQVNVSGGIYVSVQTCNWHAANLA